jgi:hypothetical protein
MANSGLSTGNRGSGRDRVDPARLACSNAGSKTLSTIWCQRPEKPSKRRAERAPEADNVSGHAYIEDQLVEQPPLDCLLRLNRGHGGRGTKEARQV